MKKILAIIFTLISISSFSQGTITDFIESMEYVNTDSFKLAGDYLYLKHLVLKSENNGKIAKQQGDSVIWDEAAVTTDTTLTGNGTTSNPLKVDTTEIATTHQLSLRVPFSGADRDLEMGANSISTNTVKIDGVPLLLNTFKQGNLGGASNIFYSTGASSQPASGSVTDVVGDNYIKNQNTSAQQANFYIYGTASVNYFKVTSSGFEAAPNYVSYAGWNLRMFASANNNCYNITGGGKRILQTEGYQNPYTVNFYSNDIKTLSLTNGEATFASTIQATTAKFTNLTDGYFPIHKNDTDGLVNSNIYQNGSGNVGINTTDPSESLDVNGNAIADVLKSRVATGTAPLVVASTTLNTNLNSDLLDGQHGSYYQTASPKIKLTPEGGYAILLTNKTGANSVKGTVVIADPAVDNAFEINPINGDMPFGVVYESGIVDGSECWIVVSGIAEVLLVNTVVSARSYIAYSSSSVAGRIDIAASVPAADDVHFREIGHTLESKAGGTDVLCKCVLHFN